MSATILLIEDNPEIQNMNRRALTRSGYFVIEAATLAQGEALFESENPDLIILDIMLPDGNGLELCKQLRGKRNIPILFLSALGKETEILEGFKAGGDDYLSKPYDLNIMLAKVDVILRRTREVLDTLIKGRLALDLLSNSVTLDGADLDIGKGREFDVLFFLAKREGKTFSAEQIYESIWKQPMAGDDNAVKKILSALRKKLEPTGYMITNEYGKGYCFEIGH